MELAGICCMQALLCIFNVFVTWRSFAGWLRNRKAAAAAVAAAATDAPQLCKPAPLGTDTGVHGNTVGMQPPTAHVSVAGVMQEWALSQQTVGSEKAAAKHAYGRGQNTAA